MIIKLKEGCLVQSDNIKIVDVVNGAGDHYNIELSYFDQKKNPTCYIRCDSKEEAYELVNKLLLEINNSRRVRFV